MGTYSRKDFLRLSGLASASLLLPNFLKAAADADVQRKLLAGNTNGRILVVIQLSGGNDGLNTLVPFGDDLYHSNRPGIGLKANDIITIDKHFAFNGVMKGLADLHSAGHLAMLNSVGYPNPNRSHFRSTDIWQSASGADENWSTGWIGRYLDSCCMGQPQKPHLALEVDEVLSMALKGNINSGIAAGNPKRLFNLSNDKLVRKVSAAYVPHDHGHEHDEHNVEYLHKTLASTIQSADYLHTHADGFRSKRIYPQHEFGRQMKMIAELIRAESETVIYYVSLPGFDTHVSQNGQQNRLLKVYSDAMKQFADDLKEGGRWDDTVVLTFSEFGRRVKQNAGKGTDHGTANVLFLAGGSLNKKGILNEAPDLKNLDNGDLIYKVDFREVYATLLEKWLKTDAEKVLGGPFKLWDFVG